MSSIEKQFWLLDKQGFGAAYNVISAFRFSGLDWPRLLKAVQTVYWKYTVFRSTYSLIDGQLKCQLQESEPDLHEMDFGSHDSVGEGRALKWLESQSRRPFDLAGGPLMRIVRASFSDPSVSFVAVIFHHIVIDLQTKDLLSEIISNLYNGVEAGETGPGFSNYGDFGPWLEEWSVSPGSDGAKKYWRDQLQRVNSNIRLHSEGPDESPSGTLVDLKMDTALWQNVKAFSRKSKISPYIILLSSYHFLLSKWTGENDFCVAVPLSNRKKEEFKKTLGCFVNTIPLRLSLDPADTFYDLLAKVRRLLLLAHRFQELPATAIIEEARKTNGSLHTLYNHGFTYEHPMNLRLEGVEVEPVIIDSGQSQMDLYLRCWEEGDELEGRFEFDSDKYSLSFAKRVVASLMVFLGNTLTRPDDKLLNIPCLGDDDRALIEVFNNSRREYKGPDNLKDAFERQVQITPEAKAIIFGGEERTYSEFNAETNRLAHFLMARGIQAGDSVGVLCSRSLEMMTLIYAVMKVGAVYIPIDVELPGKRIDYILETARAQLLLTISSEKKQQEVTVGSKINLDLIRVDLQSYPVVNPETGMTGEDAAYTIFTSGSTGLPKGVVNTHLGITNRLYWMQDQFKLKEGEVVLQKTPYSFDVSVWELFWPLQVGATLAVSDPDSHRDPYRIDEQIKRFKVSVVHFVPAMLAGYLSIHPQQSETLRAVVCSGEELTVEHRNRFYEIFSNANLYNLYGPTEAAVDVTCWMCPRTEDKEMVVPIGGPIANTFLYVVDQAGNQLPVGVMGELWIGGVQVAREYIGNPELSAKAFIANPFASGRVYRTGDYARWTESGALEFLGRKDFQVKINGIRIELTEIENALMSYPEVQLCKVVSSKGGDGPVRLVAYYSTKAKREIGNIEFTDYLRQLLPKYMVPSQYIYLDDFPLTSSGKVDRKKLPEPHEMSFHSGKDDRSPGFRGRTEQIVWEAWKDVLKTDLIGLDDNFFDVGGDSLSLMSVYSRLQERFAEHMSSVDLFTYPTIRAFSGFLKGSVRTQLDNDKSHSRAERIRKSTFKRGAFKRRSRKME